MDSFIMETFMRQQSADVLGARKLYCSLGNSQPLLLSREPLNPVDINAVLVSDLMCSPVGYIAREHCALISALLEQGAVVLCRTSGPCLCIVRRLIVWTEGEEVEEQMMRVRSRSRQKTRVLEDEEA